MSDEPGHGHSPAAWALTIIVIVGFAVGTVFFFFAIVPGVVVGAVIVAIGLVVGGVMSRLGYGVRGPRYVPKVHS
jgi:hypothetical protein